MESVLTLEDLYRPVQAQLEKVQNSVEDVWDEALGLVGVPSRPCPPIAGKMLRPALCLLSAGCVGAEDMGLFVPLATTFELLHMAALVHDDVVDGACLRRGAASLNAVWDDRAAVLSGDYLVGRALTLMATYGSCAVLAATVASLRTMAEGELATFGCGNEPFGEEDCLLLAERKTASLFEAACVAPALLVDVSAQDIMSRFGRAFGIAFQLIDDLLDLSQTEAALGKPACSDVVEGKRTLPLLFMREALGREEIAVLDSMRSGHVKNTHRAWVAEALERTGARERTETVARAYANEARSALEELPASPFRQSILGLTEFILVRGS